MTGWIARLTCRIFGHDTRPTSLSEWLRDGANFYCVRCGKRFKRAHEIGW